MGLRHRLPKSFQYAGSGIREAIQNEPNFRIHLIIASLTIFTAMFLGFTPIEWVLLLFTIAFVLILELLNTSLEALTNLVSPEIRPEAKVAKDVASAMVLIAAIVSIIVGCFLFLPKLTSLSL